VQNFAYAKFKPVVPLAVFFAQVCEAKLLVSFARAKKCEKNLTPIYKPDKMYYNNILNNYFFT
jgi:hypothetical protein